MPKNQTTTAAIRETPPHADLAVQLRQLARFCLEGPAPDRGNLVTIAGAMSLAAIYIDEAGARHLELVRPSPGDYHTGDDDVGFDEEEEEKPAAKAGKKACPVHGRHRYTTVADGSRSCECGAKKKAKGSAAAPPPPAAENANEPAGAMNKPAPIDGVA